MPIPLHEQTCDRRLESIRDRNGGPQWPTSVSVGTADRRLRLNLDNPLDLGLLRAHLDAADDAVTVAEAPTATDHGWFAGRAHEIVIPLACTERPPVPPPS